MILPLEILYQLKSLYGEACEDISDEKLDELIAGFSRSLSDRLFEQLKTSDLAADPIFVNDAIVAKIKEITENPSSYADDQDTLVILSSINQASRGNVSDARKLLKGWISSFLTNSATSYALDSIKEVAEMGDKFKNSPGHANKRQAQINKDMLVFNDFNSLKSQGTDKQAIYDRLTNKYSLSIRQIQRIMKKYKNDI
jgi:hypothetical protein